MTIQVNGTAQSAQEQRELNQLISDLNQWINQARRLTDQTRQVIRNYNAMGYGADIGAAAPDEQLTNSTQSREVADVRTALKAVLSFAILRGDLTQAQADALLQEVFNTPDETTVLPEDIIDLVNTWI